MSMARIMIEVIFMIFIFNLLNLWNDSVSPKEENIAKNGKKTR